MDNEGYKRLEHAKREALVAGCFKKDRDVFSPFDLSDAQRKHLNELVGKLPPLTKEQMKMLDDGERVRRKLTEMVMNDIEAKQVRDIFGDLITRETHEVDFDVESEIRDEMCRAVAKNIRVRPKKSEYEK